LIDYVLKIIKEAKNIDKTNPYASFLELHIIRNLIYKNPYEKESKNNFRIYQKTLEHLIENDKKKKLKPREICILISCVITHLQNLQQIDGKDYHLELQKWFKKAETIDSTSPEIAIVKAQYELKIGNRKESLKAFQVYSKNCLIGDQYLCDAYYFSSWLQHLTGENIDVCLSSFQKGLIAEKESSIVYDHLNFDKKFEPSSNPKLIMKKIFEKKGIQMSKECNVCKKTENLKSCSRCKIVSYCGSECQKIDWQLHKLTCVKK